MVAEHLSVEEVAGIKEAFDTMDVGKRGKINLEELRVGLRKLGQQIPDADLQILMEAVRLAQLFILFNPCDILLLIWSSLWLKESLAQQCSAFAAMLLFLVGLLFPLELFCVLQIKLSL